MDVVQRGNISVMHLKDKKDVVLLSTLHKSHHG